MEEGKAGKCPKCGGEMKYGATSGDFRILKQGDLVGDRANPLYCQGCGFVELYKEASMKEPRRWRVPSLAVEKASTGEAAKKPQESREDETKARTEKKLIR